MSNDIIRGDVNLKRFGNFIFPHHRTRDLHEVRVFKAELKQPNGKVGGQRIVIKPAVGARAYTTYTQRIYYALVLIWYEKGEQDGSLIFSLRELARRLRLQWGGDTADRLVREIQCLNETTINWILSFERADHIGRDSLEGFHVLDRIRIERGEERRVHGTRFEVNCLIKFNDQIVANIIANKISPINFSALLSFKSGIAEMLYVRVDSLLATLRLCQWSSQTIIEELRLEDIAEYTRNAATRRRLLSKIAREMHGKPTSTGEVIVAVVERTANGKDWKLICTKSKRPGALSVHDRKNLPLLNKDPEHVTYLAREIADSVGYREENAALYHKLSRHYPENLIFRVLAEYKAERPANLRKPAGYFIDLFHRLAHRAGLEWIKDCGLDCVRRPGSAPF